MNEDKLFKEISSRIHRKDWIETVIKEDFSDEIESVFLMIKIVKKNKEVFENAQIKTLDGKVHIAQISVPDEKTIEIPYDKELLMNILTGFLRYEEDKISELKNKL